MATPMTIATPMTMATPSDAGFLSDAPSRPSQNARRRNHWGSSARPSGLPSESQGDDAATPHSGFEDDQVPQRTRRGAPLDVPRVEDRIGLTVQEHFENFIETFVDNDVTNANPLSSAQQPTSSAVTTDKFYVAQIHAMRVYQLSTFYINYDHVLAHDERGHLARAISESYYRVSPFLTNALHNMIAKHEPQYFREHRQPASSSSGASVAGTGSQSESTMNARTANQQTDKLFAVAFYNLPLVSRVRSLRAHNIGQLLSISGTVTRTSEVRPELSMATFVCEACMTTVRDVEQTFRYTEPTQCLNLECNNRMAWRLDIRHSTFVDWQKVRIQENSSEIPTGSMPRTMDVILRGEMVDRAKAGEKCIFTGALIVVPDVAALGLPGNKVRSIRDDRGGDAGGNGVSGLQSLGVRDLNYRLAFLGCMVTPDTTGSSGSSSNSTKNIADIVATMTQSGASVDPHAQEDQEEAQAAALASLNPAEIDDLRNMVHSPHIYARLVSSLAPMVWGHDVIKKGLLLQLMSGVHKRTPEGMALRGDLNICIVGDPSTSKSQFLKYIVSFAPRAVYTSGKASSAAGLTAAVVKDEETGEFTIEAGALMLADNGICAIDEFDKMDIADQVAIHEAMEQQTISIAKAGIQATLNARTSILAAANPVGGRYNRKITLRANINMSAPIMSRFDLFFVLLDECNESVDRRLAKHIVAIHQQRDEAIEPEFSTEQLQRYIRFARTFRPELTPDAKEHLVERYKELRRDDAQGGVGKNSYRITVRQLESLIRLSEAIAKANCVDEITVAFVDEAFGLLRQSIITVERDDVDFDEDEDADEELEQAGAQLLAAAEAVTGRDVEMGDAGESQENGQGQRQEGQEAQGAGKKKTAIPFEKYAEMVDMFVSRVREAEEAEEEKAKEKEKEKEGGGEAGTGDGGDGGDGVEAETLLNWYLEQREQELETEEEYRRELGVAKRVLRRMVKENILMAIRGDGLAEPASSADPDPDAAASQKVMYIVHPNCAYEEY